MNRITTSKATHLVLTIAHRYKRDILMEQFNEWLNEWIGKLLIGDYDDLMLMDGPTVITLYVPIDQIKLVQLYRLSECKSTDAFIEGLLRKAHMLHDINFMLHYCSMANLET